MERDKKYGRIEQNNQLMISSIYLKYIFIRGYYYWGREEAREQKNIGMYTD